MIELTEAVIKLAETVQWAGLSIAIAILVNAIKFK